MLPPGLQERLSAKEVEYFASYDRLLAQYTAHYPALDLTGAAQVSCWGNGPRLSLRRLWLLLPSRLVSAPRLRASLSSLTPAR